MIKARIFFIILLVFSVLFFIMDSGYLSFRCLIATVSACALSIFYLFICNKKLKPFFTEGNDLIHAESDAELMLTLTNGSKLFGILCAKCNIRIENTYTGEVVFENFPVSVARNSSATLCLNYSSKRCGHIETRIESISYYDLFFCFSKKQKVSFEQCSSVTSTVLPKLHRVSFRPVRTAPPLGDHYSYSTHKAGNEPPDVFDYREFRDGDSFKWISAKLSAKSDVPIIKRFSLPQPPCPMILHAVTTSASPEALQLAAECFASLGVAISADSKGCNMVYHCDRGYVKEHMDSAVRVPLLFTVLFSAKRADHDRVALKRFVRAAMPTTLIIITDEYDADMFRAMGSLRIHTTVLCITNDKNISENFETCRVVSVNADNISDILGGDLQ